MSTRLEQRRSILMMVVCSVLWSIAGIFIKMVPWNPLVIAGGRSLIASVLVLLFMAKNRIRFRFNRQSLVSGLLLCATFFAFVTANKLTTAANAIVLQFTAPVFIMLFSFLFFRQRFRRQDLILVAVTMGGISLCFIDQLSTGNLAGDLTAVASGVVMAGMYIATGRADEESRMTGIFLGQLFTAVIGVPMMFVFPTPFSTRAVLCILVLGVVQLGIPYILFALAVKHCSPLACCLIGAFEPVLNPLWVFLFDGEAPGVFALVGGVIVITAITVWSVYSERTASAQAEESAQAETGEGEPERDPSLP